MCIRDRIVVNSKPQWHEDLALISFAGGWHCWSCHRCGLWLHCWDDKPSLHGLERGLWLLAV
eukprot:4950456-Amphidinium_carterae.2